MEAFKCLSNGCGRNHNTLLHDINFSLFRNPANKPFVNTGNTPAKLTSRSTTATTGAGGKRVGLGIIPVKLEINNGATILTYALMDTGSELSFVLKSLVDILGFNDNTQTLTLTGITGSVDIESQSVGVTVKSLDNQTIVELGNVRTVNSMPISHNCIPTISDLNNWEHLRDIPYGQLDNLEVGLIIGLRDRPHLFIQTDSRTGGETDPIALRYSLGWMILGPLRDGQEPEKCERIVNFITEGSQAHDELKDDPERLWNTDFGDIGVDKTCMSIEDRRALCAIEESLTFIDGHFQVALPWRNSPPYLPLNRIIAEQRAHGLKRRFYNNPNLFEKYSAVIDDYVIKGHAERIPKNCLDVGDKPVWYLPHHPVTHPLKPEKPRAVCDCAAKYRGTSLNQQLLQGPDFANKLIGVLMRFRQNKIGIVADIEAMFHQIRVDPRDYDAFRFLWCNNNDLSDELVEYRMLKHIFGATSSPCVANYCLKKSADDYDSDTVNAITRNMYVDDLMKAVGSADSALKLITELSELLSKCGFNLTNGVRIVEMFYPLYQFLSALNLWLI